MDKFELALADDDIVIRSHDSDVTSVAVELTESMLEIYNLAGKIAEHGLSASCLFLAAHPGLRDAVLEGRSSGAPGDLAVPLLSGTPDLPKLKLDSFLKARTMRYLRPGDAPFHSSAVLMPVIDFLNHDFLGSSYDHETEGASRFISVRVARPHPGEGLECYGCYGPYDELDTWLNYNFVDSAAPFLRSAPLVVNLGRLGNIAVAAFAGSSEGPLPDHLKDLGFYFPARVIRDRRGISVSSLIIPGPYAPRSLRRVLGHLIGELDFEYRNHLSLVEAAEAEILGKNQVYFESLAASLKKTNPADPWWSATIAALQATCGRQLERLDAYRHMAK